MTVAEQTMPSVDEVHDFPYGTITYRDSSHRYKFNGKPIVSVTTVLGEMAKPALVYWSAKMAAAMVATLLAPRVGSTTPLTTDEVDAICEAARRAHIDVKEDAGRRGNIVHDAIHAYHADFFNTAAPTEPDALKAWTLFVEWFASSGYAIVDAERVVCDPQGRYAGRFDLLLRAPDGSLVIADAKTGKGIYPEHAFQNSAYRAAYQAETGTHIAATLVIHCHADSPLEMLYRTDQEADEDYAVFEALLSVLSGKSSVDQQIKTMRKDAA